MPNGSRKTSNPLIAKPGKIIWQHPRRSRELINETKGNRNRWRLLQGEKSQKTCRLVQATSGPADRRSMGRMVVSLARLQESKEIGFDNLEHIRRRHEILRPGQTRPHDQLSRRQSEKDAGTVEKGRRLDRSKNRGLGIWQVRL